MRKIEEKLNLVSKNDMMNLVNVHPITQKSKNFTSMGYFYPKYISPIELDNFREKKIIKLKLCPKFPYGI